jgi:hypothetical protein
VELPGIEPVSRSWSLSQTGTELRNDIWCNSPEMTSVDTKCAQPPLELQRQSRSPRAPDCARHARLDANDIDQ